MRTILGLDVGRYAVKAVLADRRDPRRILRCESLRLPAAGGDRLELIRNWIAGLGIGRPPCVLGLPGSSAVFQAILPEPNDPRPLATVAAVEVLKFNDIASEEMVYDAAPAPLRPDDKRMLIVMARPTLLNGVVSMAGELGLDVVDIVATPVALFNALADLPGGAPEDVRLFLDIGQSSTQVAVGTGRSLLFARAFASGGQAFTDAAARHTKVAYAEAERLKVAQGGLSAPAQPLHEGLLAAAGVWLREVESCLAVYQNVMPAAHARPVRIVMSGGAAILPGLAEFVQAKLGLPTVLAPPLPTARKGTTAGPEYAVAAGLARAGSRGALVRLSLLPGALRDNLLFRRQKPFWIAAGIAATLILCVSLAAGYRDQYRREQLLLVQQAKLTRLQELADRIQLERTLNAEIQKLAQPLVSLVSGGPVLRDLITLVAESKHTNDWLTLICDADAYFQGFPKPPERRREPGADKAPPLPPPGKNLQEMTRFDRVIVEGVTAEGSLTTVNDLIGRLRSSPLIATADLLPDDMRAKSVVTGAVGRLPEGSRTFSIDIKLRTP